MLSRLRQTATDIRCRLIHLLAGNMVVAVNLYSSAESAVYVPAGRKSYLQGCVFADTNERMVDLLRRTGVLPHDEAPHGSGSIIFGARDVRKAAADLETGRRETIGTHNDRR